MLCRSHNRLPPQLRILIVGDLEAAHDLYGEALGLPVLRRVERGLLLGAGTPPLPILTLCSADSLRLEGSRRLIHGLLVAQGGSWVQLATIDLETALARLRAHGAHIVRPAARRADGTHAAAALDLWDNTLRLVERDPAGPALTASG